MLSTTPTPPGAARWVDGFWSFAGEVAQHRVLPDGCIDFIFDLVSGCARVVGPMRTAEVVALSGTTRLFGVRFWPGAASVYLDVAPHELVDLDVPLAEVCARPAGRQRARRLADAVAETGTHAQRADLVAEFLADEGNRRRPLDARIRRAVACIHAGGGGIPLADIAAQVNLGERHLERLFQQHVGLPPKLFGRIMRLQRALQLATNFRGSQASLALRAGYADESHWLRDFRALVGVSPSEWRAERNVGFVQAQRSPVEASSRHETRQADNAAGG